MLNPQEALERLRVGNRRYVAGERMANPGSLADRRAELVAGQSPFAAIIGCADSRVPVEQVFDQGLGDLFVTRVAGNLAAGHQVGSIEFAVTQFEIPLVLVLGHSGCAAVRGALAMLEDPEQEWPRNLKGLLEAVRPGLEGVFSG
ncbi:MAG: carbonic anhydrase, partial [Candidatus Paceibacteria bacterium]